MENSQIADEAAAWVIRMDRDGERNEVRTEFEQWLAADRRRQGAYARAAAAWTMLDRASVLAMTPQRRPLISRRALMAGGAIAAGVVATAGLAALQRPRAETFRTALGEMRRIRLEDGSTMVLNAGSAVEVVMTREARRLKLLGGEAWFQVAKNPDRPFLVDTGAAEVRAVGTAFAVGRLSGAVDVMVTEGMVELRREARAPTPAIKLSAGSRASVGKAGDVQTAKVSPADMQRSLAWRDGQIALDGDTLGQAVVQFNRYNLRKLVIESPELEDAKLVGWFWLDDPDAFATAAARTLGADVRLRDSQIVLTAKRQTPVS